jgi:CubicO group peptidase (beta-lactamase class C family)
MPAIGEGSSRVRPSHTLQFAFLRSAAILLVCALSLTTSLVAQTYDAAAAFEQGFTSQSNPNGVWSYGYSSGFATPATLYTQTAQPGINGPNVQYWLSPSVNIGESPAAEFNNGPAYDNGNVDFLANQLVLVAGIGGQYSDLVFTAPATGVYSILGSFRGDQYGIGTLVGVVANGNVLFSSSVTAEGQIVPFNTEANLNAGQTVVFSVGPGGGYQNTGVSATITTQTSPLPLFITTTALPNAGSGGAYSQALAAAGGSGTGYTWCVQPGSGCLQSGPPLPAGFTLSSGGVLSSTGSPAAWANSYTFTVQVTDSAGNLATQPLTLVIQLVAQTPVSGQPVPSLSQFDTVMLGLMSKWSIPGGALAITSQGRLVFARGYGYADTATEEPVQPDSLFRLASISKPFTAAAALKLIEQGKLQLNTTAFGVLSNLTPLSGATVDPRIYTITVQELLEHTGGWDSSIAGDPPFEYVDTAATAFGVTPPATPDLLIRYMMGQPLQYAPGTTYAYSNFGYIVLGQVIEQVSGQSYASFVNDYILAPAGIFSMQPGASLLSGRLPGEVMYYDYPEAPLVGSVSPPLGALVPVPYGGFSVELMLANAGWIASTMDLLRFADNINGQLTPGILNSPPTGFVGYVPPVGADWGWIFQGSLSGTSTDVHLDTGFQVNGNVTFAVLFNTRNNGNPSPGIPADADAQILSTVQGVSTWPSGDLFPIYSGTTSACEFSLPSSGISVGAGSGATQASINATNYCAWTAVSNASWLTIDSGSPGIGNGAVTYWVAGNPTTAQRSGTLMIGGQTFTVTQAGTLAPPPTQYQLTITASPSVGGTVTPANGSSYPAGTVVPITATPASGYEFTGWTGPVASSSSASTTVTMSAAESVTANFSSPSTPAAFFAGEVSLGSGVEYLKFPNSTVFGYYNFVASAIFYHYDMGYEAFIPGSASDVYLYDFTSGHWWYTSNTLFPYLYDFTLKTWVYYFPNTTSPGHYTTNPRYFSNLTTGQIFTM